MWDSVERKRALSEHTFLSPHLSVLPDFQNFCGGLKWLSYGWFRKEVNLPEKPNLQKCNNQEYEVLKKSFQKLLT